MTFGPSSARHTALPEIHSWWFQPGDHGNIPDPAQIPHVAASWRRRMNSPKWMLAPAGLALLLGVAAAQAGEISMDVRGLAVATQGPASDDAPAQPSQSSTDAGSYEMPASQSRRWRMISPAQAIRGLPMTPERLPKRLPPRPQAVPATHCQRHRNHAIAGNHWFPAQSADTRHKFPRGVSQGRRSASPTVDFGQRIAQATCTRFEQVVWRRNRPALPARVAQSRQAI